MSDPTQKKLEAKSVGYKIGVAESERSLSNLGLTVRVYRRPQIAHDKDERSFFLDCQKSQSPARISRL
jgi:hypothetical protein